MDTNNNWTREEFKAYLLMHAARIDSQVVEEEIDLLHEKISDYVYHKIKKEIDQDNDYQRVEKLLNYISKEKFTKEGKEKLLEELKELFMVDGEYGDMERAVFRFLKKIFDKRPYNS